VPAATLEDMQRKMIAIGGHRGE